MQKQRQVIRKRSERGVTLIEMIVVVIIIGIFVALVGPNLFKQPDRARVVAAKAQIASFMGELIEFKAATGVYPTNEQGLQALRTAPEGVAGWDGPYASKDIPADPWNHPYIYKYPGEHGDQPDILCYGADGQPGGEGNNADIASWK